MNWLQRIRGKPAEQDAKKLIKFRRTQFQQILRNYGCILDLMADAAEKQGGGFVLDQKYIVSLADNLFNLSKALVFDLIVMIQKRNLAFLDLLERFEFEGKELLYSPQIKGEKESHAKETQHPGPKDVNTETLAKILASRAVLYRNTGQVAARGAAEGPVFNLKTEPGADNFTKGAVWVAADLKQAAELSRVINQVSAILADADDPSSYACRLARSHRVPTIVGLRDATERLKTGEHITVDAEENTIYQGSIPDLINYYRAHLGGRQGEEFEYQLLRKFRRKVFPLSLFEVRDRLPGVSDVKTLHDLVHLAHELAGEAFVELAMNTRYLKAASKEFARTPAHPVFVIDLEIKPGKITESESRPDVPPKNFIVDAFMTGLQKYEEKNKRMVQKKEEISMFAFTRNEEATLILPCPRGFDMLDIVMSGNESLNYIYCRFDSRFWDMDQRFARQNAALDILSRLDFAAADTNRAVTAWTTHMDNAEVKEKLEILGQVCGFLKERDKMGWRREAIASDIEEFMRNCITKNQGS